MLGELYYRLRKRDEEVAELRARVAELEEMNLTKNAEPEREEQQS